MNAMKTGNLCRAPFSSMNKAIASWVDIPHLQRCEPAVNADQVYLLQASGAWMIDASNHPLVSVPNWMHCGKQERRRNERTASPPVCPSSHGQSLPCGDETSLYLCVKSGGPINRSLAAEMHDPIDPPDLWTSKMQHSSYCSGESGGGRALTIAEERCHWWT